MPETSAAVRSETLALLREIPHPVERVGELLGELRADLVARPEEAAEVLHPFEVGDGHAAGVREDVGQDGNPSLAEDLVGLERRRAVRALRDHPRAARAARSRR